MSRKETAISIIKTLHQAGHEAYFAGGCVRDTLRGLEPKDYDIATSARPEQIQSLFSRTIPVGVHFGVILVIEQGQPFEVATFRSEGQYSDGRHPGQVSYTTVEEDAKRRDFTVNGLYHDLKTDRILDFVGGRADLKAKILRTIGDPSERFLEDHLRMLRAVRFSVQLGFEIESETLKAIKKHYQKIESVSQERIREELVKTLTSENPARGIELMDETGLLALILPEMITLKGVAQPMQYHPEGDVYVHTMLLMKGLSHAPIELAMGALLHDIAKPATYVEAADRIRFHGHDRIGAEMAKTICKRLTFPNDQTELICSLVREHLRFKDAFQMRQSTLRRFFSLPRFDLHMELHRLDCLASHGLLDAYHFCQKKLEEFSKLPPPPKRLITGEDLKTLGFSSGPQMGKVLRAVEDAILEGDIQTKDQALEFVKTHFKGAH